MYNHFAVDSFCIYDRMEIHYYSYKRFLEGNGNIFRPITKHVSSLLGLHNVVLGCVRLCNGSKSDVHASPIFELTLINIRSPLRSAAPYDVCVIAFAAVHKGCAIIRSSTNCDMVSIVYPYLSPSINYDFSPLTPFHNGSF